jgi:hypothetical protein
MSGDKTIDTDRFFGESRAMSNIVGAIVLVLAAIGVGAVVFTQSSAFADNIQEQPKASIAADPGANNVNLTVRSADNADDLTIKAPNGDITTFDADEAEVGDTASVSGLSNGDKVTVVATVDPDQNRTVLDYTHGE